MANVYIERLEDGRYAVRERGKPPITTAKTQAEAIAAAHRIFPDVNLDIERVRDTDRGSRDKWRSE